MSAKHEAIKRQVMVDWTKHNRGTLWPNSQVTTKIQGRTIKCGLGSGTADLVGIEHYNDTWETDHHGKWVSIEVKTRFDNGVFDWLSDKQVKHCYTVLRNKGHYYLALEKPGCTITNGLYDLYRVYEIKDIERIKESWHKEFKEPIV
jgi:hypothetical protein